ncbi:MAG TPA: M13 family metallopeptidase [Bryobacteraceae bacterium]|nr:M13 family metallopeptidase [Bryobacteraceae bacterium]
MSTLRGSWPRLLFALVSAALLPAADPSSASGIDMKAMNPVVSACQNFYQYACGAWRDNNPIPPDRARWSRFDELREHNLGIEHDILERLAPANAKRTPLEQRIGDFYAACLDEPAIEAQGIQPIAALLAGIEQIGSKQDLAAEVVRLHQNGVRVLFNFGVRADAKNTKEQIANVDQGGLGLPDRDYYLRDDPRSVTLRTQYQEHVRRMFELLAAAEGRGASDSTAGAQAVLNLETALAKASMDRVARRNPNNLYHRLPVNELVTLTPDFGWKAYLESIGIPPIQSLNVTAPDFVKELDATIRNTSLEDLKSYLTWHVLSTNAEVLPRAFADEDFHFSGQILRGVKQQPARWKRCVQATDRELGEALGQKYVEIAFSGPSKAKALALVGEIENEMAKDIRSAAWMSPETKDQALTKLHEVTNKIGYPEHWRDYSSVKIVRGDYFGDSLRARQFELQRNLAKIGKPVDKTEWSMTPPTVNAYYSPPMNNINFPAGILQPPFYNPKADEAVNYGAIGVVIGHELTHGFDDQGRRYDGQGNVRDWWTAADAKAFEARADCVAKEYGNFSPAPGVHLNGRLTLGENAADNGGIHLAYMALMDSLAGKVLPKKDGFTPQQRFFLGYAQIWCENTTEQTARLNAQTDPHSPGEFRVNGVVQNLPEFREAFSCKIGDPMVSTDPCRVW